MRSLSWKSLCLIAATLLSFSAFAGGGDLKMQATLIWGCDDPMPKDQKIKPVSGEIAAEFAKIFKWKHYYEVKTEEAKISDKGTQKFVLSDKCTVELTNQGGKFEAKLFGEGKLLKTLTFPVEHGKHSVLAGDDKNATAWFVILTPKQ